jgi:hypothetical protein
MLTLTASSPICCVQQKPIYNNAVNCRFLAIALFVLIAIGLAGCGVGRTIMSPFHPSGAAPSANTSDVAHPGRPLPVASPSPRGASRKSTQRSATPTPTPATTKTNTSTAITGQFPVAKPVPGKPGLVFNPFKSNAGYIDVSGYAPGSKVKDPESQKIFIVP